VEGTTPAEPPTPPGGPSDAEPATAYALPATAHPLPTLDDLQQRAHVVGIPMRVRFRGVEVREAMLFEGPGGWCEWGPFPEYHPAEAATWLRAALEAGWGDWPAPVHPWVPVNATVPAVIPAVAYALVEASGCWAAKVKVGEPGQSLRDDIERVAAVREVLGPAGRIRVDANAAWSLDQAAEALGALMPYGLEYVEQPCRTVEELAALRLRVPVPIAVDEPVRRGGGDPLATAILSAADIVIVKVAPLGGFAAARRVADGCGKPVVVSSALETSVGMAAGLAFAASLPELPYACGLGTVGLLTADLAAEPLLPIGGWLPSDRGRVAPDPLRLHELAAPPDREAWWRSRLADAYAVLAAPPS
jgi:O-succinylbenzoate synthase